MTCLGNKLNWSCQMCGKKAVRAVAYRWTSLCPNLTSSDPMIICAKCARREIGTKNKKGWDKLNGKT